MTLSMKKREVMIGGAARPRGRPALPMHLRRRSPFQLMLRPDERERLEWMAREDGAPSLAAWVREQLRLSD